MHTAAMHTAAICMHTAAMHAAGAMRVAAIRAAAVHRLRTAAMREACVCCASCGACFSMQHVPAVRGMIQHRYVEAWGRVLPCDGHVYRLSPSVAGMAGHMQAHVWCAREACACVVKGLGMHKVYHMLRHR
jgi:ribosomal protein L30/L7E